MDGLSQGSLLSKTMLQVNQILQKGRYRVLAQNTQDTGELSYQAYDNSLKANVTLQKVCEKDGSAESHGADFAKHLMEIKHDSLFHIYDFFLVNNQQYLVSETVQGELISQFINQSKSLPELTDFISWADQLLDAAVCLQNRIPPIIHGEIKPQNIRIGAKNQIKLVLFGFCKTNELSPDAEELAFLPLERIWKSLDSTSRQFILRSLSEKSEELLEQSADVRSDVYSIGATLYYLATGKYPINSLERIIDIVEGKPDPLLPLHQVNSAVPPEISSIVMKALKVNREDRFRSALIMQSILRGTVIRLKHIVGEKVVAALKVNSTEKKPEEQLQESVKPEMFIETPQFAKLVDAQSVETRNSLTETETTVDVAVHPEIYVPAEPIEETETKFVKETEPINQTDLEPKAEKIEYNFEDNDEIFTIPQESGSGLRRAAAFVIGLLVLAGIGWGIWTLNSGKPPAVSESVPQQNVVSPAPTAAPETQATVAPSVAPTPEIVAEPTVPGQELKQPVAPIKPPVAVATPTPVKKKPEPPKTAAVPKKVTVDDLINDN